MSVTVLTTPRLAGVLQRAQVSGGRQPCRECSGGIIVNSPNCRPIVEKKDLVDV